MVTYKEALPKVLTVLNDRFKCVDASDIGEHDSLDAFKMDSLDIIELVLSLEEAFDIELSDEEVTRMTNEGCSAKDLTEKVLSKL